MTEQEILARLRELGHPGIRELDEHHALGGIFIVRLYESFDNRWSDATVEGNLEWAFKVWMEKTQEGTTSKDADDISYYRICPMERPKPERNPS